MYRRFNAAVILILSLLMVGSISSPADAASYASDSANLANRERTSRGLRAEDWASDLAEVARRHSARMAAKRQIFHNPNLGSDVNNWQEIGENVGTGSTVRRIHDAFMASSGHRANILKRGDNFIGVGVVTGSDGKLYLTQIFVRRSVSRTVSYDRPSRTRSATVYAAPRRRRKPAPVKPKPQTVAVLLRLLAID